MKNLMAAIATTNATALPISKVVRLSANKACPSGSSNNFSNLYLTFILIYQPNFKLEHLIFQQMWNIKMKR